MGTTPQFGASFNTITPTQSDTKAKRAMDRVLSEGTDVLDVGKVAEAGLKATVMLNEAEKSAKATEAQGNWLRLSQSEGYIRATETDKLEMIDEYRNMYLQDGGEEDVGYLTALQLSSGQYSLNYKGLLEKEDNAKYNAAYPRFLAEKDKIEQLASQGKPVDVKSFPKQFVDQYTEANPRLEKANVSRALLGGMYKDAMTEAVNAPDTYEGLEYLEKVIAEIKAPYQDPMFLTTKEKKGREYINAQERQLQNLLTAKRKAVILARDNAREGNKAEGYLTLSDDEVMKDLMFKYSDTNGNIDYTKVDKEFNEYQKEKVETLQYNNYAANYTPTEKLPYEYTKNQKITKVHKNLVAKSLFSALTKGKDKDFVSIVNANAGYLQEAKKQSLNYLFNPSLSTEERTAAWANTKQLLDDPNSAMALKTLMGEDFSTITAVATAMDYVPGMDLDTATEMAAKLKANPDEFKVREKDVLKKMTTDAISYGPMNNEFRKIVSMKMAMGVDEDTAYKTTRELFDERVKEIGNTKVFEVSGKVPTVLNSKAKEIFNRTFQRQLNRFVEANGGMPVRVEVLSDGKAIVKSDELGARLRAGNTTYIDLGKLERISHEKALMLKKGGAEETLDDIGEVLYDLGAAIPKYNEYHNKKGIGFIEGIRQDIDKGFHKYVKPYTDSIMEFFRGDEVREDLLDDVSKELMKETPVSLNNPYVDDENVDLQKVVKLESGGDYKAVNPSTKAFGKYQFLPSTAKHYAERLGIKEEEIALPENQDLMFAAFTKDNMKGLEKKGLPINTFTVYAAHQQGVRGAEEILKGKPLSKARIRNIKANLPYSKETLEKMSAEELRQAWIEYYKQRTL